MLLVKEAKLEKQPTEWLCLHDLPAELGRQCNGRAGGWGASESTEHFQGSEHALDGPLTADMQIPGDL